MDDKLGDILENNKIRKIRMNKADIRNLPPIITNKKIVTLNVECSMASDEEYQTCNFQDDYGQIHTVRNIAFITHEVKHPIIASYKSYNNNLITRAEFPDKQICEVMGHNRSGLTAKCGGLYHENGE